MIQKCVFDTWNYAKILRNGEVEHAEVHVEALTQALQENIYTRDEVDMRFERAMKRLDQAMLRQDKLMAELELRSERNLKEVELRFERAMNRYLVTTISILGSLIVLATAVSTFAHTLIH